MLGVAIRGYKKIKQHIKYSTQPFKPSSHLQFLSLLHKHQAFALKGVEQTRLWERSAYQHDGCAGNIPGRGLFANTSPRSVQQWHSKEWVRRQLLEVHFRNSWGEGSAMYASNYEAG
eukprot:1924094-Amphidinium_carterae.1